jgi:hypothetical protein
MKKVYLKRFSYLLYRPNTTGKGELHNVIYKNQNGLLRSLLNVFTNQNNEMQTNESLPY